MKQSLTVVLLFCNYILANAQNEVVISNQNGFTISYKTQKLSEGNKDKWLVTVLAINNTAEKVFYAIPTLKQNDGSYKVNPLVNQASSKVTVRNATGFLASGDVKIKGEQTLLFTENKTGLLFQYDPGRLYNYENTVNVKHGDTPIVTVTHTYQLKNGSDYNIETSSTLIDGDYKTSCGNGFFTITLKDENNKTYLNQTINGKEIKWIKKSSTQFAKETDEGTTLSYNKTKKTFLFSSSDGITCDWTKQ